ncbi:type II toxin-antitoxin system PemK/MazF family toxin [Rhizobium leguminosarum]|uniref:type II toxin-antitoxin system PemK/MazF family toxin n=1 Tax=Rhizobium leguminosarum TaxID=384 RepID=UPI0013F16549|nr:type II toxin-antitoxin system PemK/MazF family toxin [Rhizobium leguminosarum]
MKPATTIRTSVNAGSMSPDRSVERSIPVHANDRHLRGARPEWNSSTLTIGRKPSAREAYWIGSPSGACAPEFTGYHPGVIIRPSPTFSQSFGSVMFVPLTTAPREVLEGLPLPPYVRELSENPGPDKSTTVWAVCDKVMTANLCRLEQYVDHRTNRKYVPKLGDRDFEAILEGIASAVVPLRTFVENRVKEAFAAEFENLREDHERAMERLEFEVLDRLTRP